MKILRCIKSNFTDLYSKTYFMYKSKHYRCLNNIIWLLLYTLGCIKDIFAFYRYFLQLHGKIIFMTQIYYFIPYEFSHQFWVGNFHENLTDSKSP